MNLKKSKWKLICYLILGTAVLGPSLSFAYQIDTFTGYLHSGSSTLFASDNDVREYIVDTNSWDLGVGYSDAGTNLEWYYTSSLKTTWIDEPNGIYKTIGTLEWTVTNRGEELNDVRFFGLLDGWIESGFDSAVETSGFSVDAAVDPQADYWEIDDAIFGNVIANLDAGILNNSADYNVYGHPAMTLGFDIGTLLSDESFTVGFFLSDDVSTGGLRYYNDVYPDEEIYFNGVMSPGNRSGSPVPVPPTLILLGSGLLSLIGIANRKRIQK